MTQKLRLYQRGSNSRFHIEDNTNGKQESLRTSDKVEALRLLMARNEAEQQLAFNAQIARTYLAAGDPTLARRTWKEVMEAFTAPTPRAFGWNCRHWKTTRSRKS